MPYADLKQKRALDRGRVRARRARGLCASCKHPAASGRARCESCRQKHNARRRKETASQARVRTPRCDADTASGNRCSRRGKHKLTVLAVQDYTLYFCHQHQRRRQRDRRN